MNKTPSALKWLVEKRARLANDVLQTERLLEELAQRRQALEFQLTSLDATIQLYDMRLDPSMIGPVNAWQGRYGRRGALKDAALAILHQASPEWTPTTHLAAKLIVQFGLSFELRRDYRHWVHGTILVMLKRLVVDGQVERLDDPTAFVNEEAYWRMKQASSLSLADL